MYFSGALKILKQTLMNVNTVKCSGLYKLSLIQLIMFFVVKPIYSRLNLRLFLKRKGKM
jgi:hypothetical protein